MGHPQKPQPSAFVWNAGAWFGSQCGSSAWLAVMGVYWLGKDPLAAGLCLGGFLLINAWGFYLWARRDKLNAYAALQRLMLVFSVVAAAVIVVVNLRGHSEPPSEPTWASTHLPYGLIALGPALMLVFYMREQSARRRPNDASPLRGENGTQCRR